MLTQSNSPSATGQSSPGVDSLGECCSSHLFWWYRDECGRVMAEPVRARRLRDEEGRRLQQIVRRGKRESLA